MRQLPRTHHITNMHRLLTAAVTVLGLASCARAQLEDVRVKYSCIQAHASKVFLKLHEYNKTDCSGGALPGMRQTAHVAQAHPRPPCQASALPSCSWNGPPGPHTADRQTVSIQPRRGARASSRARAAVTQTRGLSAS